MVLGFGSRSTKKKAGGQNASEHGLRQSPSLPQMTTQGVAWPSTLVDVASIKENTPPQTPQTYSSHSSPQSQQAQTVGVGAAKVSFAFNENGQAVPIPFHRPFRLSQSNKERANAPGKGDVKAGSIAALYMSQHPPSAFGMKPSERSATPQSTQTTRTARRSHSQRKRIAPTFNLMVVGAQGTGKTSLLRLFIDTADISPTASAEQRASVDNFLANSLNRTDSINTACVEICESRVDRILLSLIDTPGLDFQENHQLKLERQVSDIMKYLDLQFADTMDEEFKVVRKSKGDQHVHLCIYMIDPSSLMTPSERETLSKPSFLSRPSLDKDALPKTEPGQLCMSPLDLRIIRRLSDRVNVLPVVARSDTLTDERLTAVKQTISRELTRAKLGFGVFGTPRFDEEPVPANPAVTANPPANGSMNARVSTTSSARSVRSTKSTGSSSKPHPEDEGDSDDDERRARSVIKLNQRRRSVARSTSRSRLELAEEEDKHTPMALDHADPESLAAVRFSAGYLAQNLHKSASNSNMKGNGREGSRARMSNRERLRQQFIEMMPFNVIMPEATPHRRALKAPPPLRPVSAYSADSGYPLTPVTQNGDSVEDAVTPTGARPLSEVGHGHSSENKENGILTPRHSSHEHLPYLSSGAPRDLKGVFVRRFRWGTVDVLDPTHCDFAALRTAIFSTHMKVLKTNTKEVLYEKYRTEKLLARRATRNISEEERKRLLEDLGL